MQSRMEKYHTKEEKKYERTKKNTKLYEEVYDDIYKDMSYKNMEVIDSAREINIGKLKNMLEDKYDTRQYRTLKNYSLDDTNDFEKPFDLIDENKSHDINEIINEAKSKRAFIEEAKEKQKFIEFKERKTTISKSDYDTLEKEEQELEELINTMAIKTVNTNTDDALDLLSDLKGAENTIVTTPIEATFDTESAIQNTTADLEKTLARADKNFYTDSNMFTKNDFEDFSTLTSGLQVKKKGKKIFIITLIFIILAACAYLAYKNFIAN